MAPRLIISDNRDDPGNPLVLDGEAIEGAASDPAAIGKLMVDQVWAEGTDPTGSALYYEHSSNKHRRLLAFETGYEELMTGGWGGCWSHLSSWSGNALAWSRPPAVAWWKSTAATGACCWWSSWMWPGTEASRVRFFPYR